MSTLSQQSSHTQQLFFTFKQIPQLDMKHHLIHILLTLYISQSRRQLISVLINLQILSQIYKFPFMCTFIKFQFQNITFDKIEFNNIAEQMQETCQHEFQPIQNYLVQSKLILLLHVIRCQPQSTQQFTFSRSLKTQPKSKIVQCNICVTKINNSNLKNSDFTRILFILCTGRQIYYLICHTTLKEICGKTRLQCYFCQNKC
eukprot:TRINITY_DN771_c1_g1_i3.p1 TRINITY_DN771_c1_g1~~TRINITY_DN771_c1_g1_i3.p1  ORF type:complete len:230 (+),score=-33.43 TRINITY_DN771_c1_g1_i3:87-692(+)